MEQFISIITEVGFPIACVIALGFFVWKLYQQSVDRENKLYTELGACREVNSRALDTLAVYSEKLGTIQTDISEIKSDIAHLKHEE